MKNQSELSLGKLSTKLKLQQECLRLHDNKLDAFTSNVSKPPLMIIQPITHRVRYFSNLPIYIDFSNN